MIHIIIKQIDHNKIIIKDYSNIYKIYYDDKFHISGLPIHAFGDIIVDNENYKFYLDDRSYRLFLSIQNRFKGKINGYRNFINQDSYGNYLYFTNNFYTKQKLNENVKDLYLNIKYVNKNNQNTIIHII